MPSCTTTQPLTPGEALRAPTLFRAWLYQQQGLSFYAPSDPRFCPLAQFLGEATCASGVSVGTFVVHYHARQDDRVFLPLWAQRFIILWDLCAQLPGTRSAMQARAIIWATLLLCRHRSC